MIAGKKRDPAGLMPPRMPERKGGGSLAKRSNRRLMRYGAKRKDRLEVREAG